jgi:hypothetical protein
MTRISSTRSVLGTSLALALGASLGACSASDTGDDDVDGITEQASQALSPAQECEAAGGTYEAAGPDSSCTIPGDPVGNSSNTKGGSETTGPGKSEPQSEEEICTGVNNKPHPCP